MRYFEVLKQRRQTLNLSLQDIGIQTQLSVDQLKAIEENNLAYFNTDLLYARILIQAYCSILGINWNQVVEDVDQELQKTARQEVERSKPLQKQQTTPGLQKAPCSSRPLSLRTAGFIVVILAFLFIGFSMMH